MVYVSDMITHKIRCQHVSYGVAYSLFCNLYTGHWSFTLMFPPNTKYQKDTFRSPKKPLLGFELEDNYFTFVHQSLS